LTGPSVRYVLLANPIRPGGAGFASWAASPAIVAGFDMNEIICQWIRARLLKAPQRGTAKGLSATTLLLENSLLTLII